jgi:geranylgeranyl diphosphate synthase, type I
MNLNTLLTQVKLHTDRKLTEFFDQKHTEVESIHPYLVNPVDQIRDFTIRGGKRTRPALCVLGYLAANIQSKTVNLEIIINEIPTDLTNLMLSIELFQSFCLIHDDIMDQDDTRRGGPTVHSFFRNEYQHKFPHPSSLPKSNLYGESIGILSGDLALAWADEFINLLNNFAVDQIYQKAKAEVILGQFLDVGSSSNMAKVPQIQINEMKTAWYSVIRPLQLGAKLAGADEHMIDHLAYFGKPVGLAYQLKDDAMDKDVSAAEFKNQSEILVSQAQKALVGLNLPPDINNLFLELSEFVINRNS